MPNDKRRRSKPDGLGSLRNMRLERHLNEPETVPHMVGRCRMLGILLSFRHPPSDRGCGLRGRTQARPMTSSFFTETMPILENYWRAIIGRNVASYKFALARSLLELDMNSS